ncbi:MAG: amidohydrolase family protein [Methanocellales archaeon]
MIKINSLEVEVIDVHVHPIDLSTHAFIPVEEVIEAMELAGVDKAVLLALDLDEVDFDKYISDEELKIALELEPAYRYVNEEILREIGKGILGLSISEEVVKEFVDKYPERFTGFGSINPNKGEEYVRRKIDRIREYNFKGLKFLPTIQFFNPEDEKMNLIYELAQEHELIISMHTGCDPGPWELPYLSRYANPRYLDRVAEKYPDLKIIAAHMGSYSRLYPGIWFKEMMDVAKKHENIYVDISATFNEFNLSLAIEEIGEERILYGSDYPAIGGYCDRETGMVNCVNWFAQLDLAVEVKKKIFGENAKRLLLL